MIEKMPLDMTRQELTDLTMCYGNVLNAYIWKEDQWHVGLVKYECRKDRDDAIENLHGLCLPNWHMQLKCSAQR